VAAGSPAVPRATPRQARGPAPGTFRPAEPKDSGDVVQLFAVAARVVCATPALLDTVSAMLAQVTFGLIPPEAQTRDACTRLWMSFARTIGSLPPGQAAIAGRALADDLDQIGQRLELMPLAAWDELPLTLDDPRRRVKVESGEGRNIERAAAKIAEMKEELSSPTLVPLERARAAAELLLALAPDRRAVELARMSSDRVLGKRDAALLTRFLTQPAHALDPSEEALIEALERAGRWLAR
jgi:hypothetical protein